MSFCHLKFLHVFAYRLLSVKVQFFTLPGVVKSSEKLCRPKKECMPFTAPKGSNRYRHIQNCPFHLGILHRNTSHRLTLLYSSESDFREPACNASCFSTLEAIGEDYKAGVGKLASLPTAANCSDKKHAVMLPQRKLRREANPATSFYISAK